MGGALRGPDAAAAADAMCQGEGWEAGLPEDDPWTSRSTEVSVESPGGEEGLREAAGEQEWVRQRQRQRKRGDNCQDGGGGGDRTVRRKILDCHQMLMSHLRGPHLRPSPNPHTGGGRCQQGGEGVEGGGSVAAERKDGGRGEMTKIRRKYQDVTVFSD